jgi:hypothetical protein
VLSDVDWDTKSNGMHDYWRQMENKILEIIDILILLTNENPHASPPFFKNKINIRKN